VKPRKKPWNIRQVINGYHDVCSANTASKIKSSIILINLINYYIKLKRKNVELTRSEKSYKTTAKH
jgi:hypothetical protein